MRLAALLLAAAALAACQRGAPPAPLTPADVLGDVRASGFARALKPRALSFPRDHGAHPLFRTEWWYLTGHLRSGEREFGYQVSLFRFGLEPGAKPAGSGWQAGQIYLAHFALTDVRAQRFHAGERLSRGAADLAGARSEDLDVWVEDISMRLDEGVLQVRAADRGFALDLSLRAAGAPVLHGEHGLSRKSAAPGNASYYYSMPRWTGGGSLHTPQGRFTVSGDGWLDREWSSGALAADQPGWDWFAMKFDDDSALMLYRLRDRRGGAHPFSGGTFITPGGEARALAPGEVDYRINRHWRSPASGTRYPVAWTIAIPVLGLEVEVEPLLDAQELDLSFRYWEGAAGLSGVRDGRPLAGRGYLELTGYD